MRVALWILVVLMVLYGLSEVFAAGSTLAAKMGWFHDPQLTLLATIVSWPRMVVWLAAVALTFVSAWLLVQRRQSAAAWFGLVVLIATLNNVINENSPVYARVFNAGERMFDWYMIAALYAVLVLAFLTVRRAASSVTPIANR
jgi:hypothetical protein